jgi:hypothetical protein
MNTRGLTEIVILTTGLQLGIISVRIYSLMVVMALVTTAMAGPVLNVIYPQRFVRRDIAEASKAALGTAAVYRILAATGHRASGGSSAASGHRATSGQGPLAEPRTAPPGGPASALGDADDAVVAVGGALAAGREHAEVVISALVPYQRPRLEVGGGIAEDMLELTAEMTRVESASQALASRGVVVKPTVRPAIDPVAELTGIAESASLLVISAEHPDYQAVIDATEVPVAVTVASAAPARWDSVAVRAGSGDDASAAAEVAAMLAAGTHAPVVVDPAGLTGRGLDRFVAGLRDAGLSTEISGQVPDGALIVTRQDGPLAGTHLIVRAGPGYTPAETAPLAAVDTGQEDR